MSTDPEEALLHAVALQTAHSILVARRRAEDDLLKARDALRENEQRLHAIVNQAAVGIAVATLQGRFIDVNRKFSDIVGYSVEQLQAMTFADLTHPDDLPDTLARVRDVLDGVVADYAHEKRYVRPDGSIVWSLTTVTLQRDAAGAPQRFIGVIEDISARKEAEIALHEETRILELLNETGQTLAAQLDLQTLLQVVTDKATALSGAEFGAFFYNTTDASGDAFLLYTLSGAPREAFERFGQPRATALFGPTFRGEGIIRCDDVLADPRYGGMAPHHGMPKGHLPVRSYLAVPVVSRAGDVIGGLFFGHSRTGIFTERTEQLIAGVAAQAAVAVDNARLFEAAQRAADERRTLLESERAARSAAERMSGIKDTFLATLSHELRTPLNAILGWSQILRAGDRNGTDLAKGLETIERNARALTRMIEDLLDMSRIAEGKVHLEVQPVEPRAFIRAALETVRHAADSKQVRITASLDDDIGTVSGDSTRLQQVMWNLLSNAIKFTPAGGTVHVTAERAPEGIGIEVVDSGVGIPPEFLPHLFERFRQADASTTRRHGGLGLGLSIVRSLVELHGGHVVITSEGDGRGTSARVLLPTTPRVGVRARHADPRDTTVAAAGSTSQLAGVRALIVDDEADARDLLTRVLEDAGAEVWAAADAEEALAGVASHRPDVIVSDIGLPGVDGYELLRHIRATDREGSTGIPAIALTAFARSEDRMRALRAGYAVHLSKPVMPSELVATVASVVASARRAG